MKKLSYPNNRAKIMRINDFLQKKWQNWPEIA
jgi:hypothetical protein